MKTTRTTCGFWLSLGLLALAPAEAENWPCFRGPTGQGISAEAGLPLEWNVTQGVAWNTPIPRDGKGDILLFGWGLELEK